MLLYAALSQAFLRSSEMAVLFNPQRVFDREVDLTSTSNEHPISLLGQRDVAEQFLRRHDAGKTCELFTRRKFECPNFLERVWPVL